MRLIWLVFCIRFALKSVAITLVDKFDDNIYLNVDNVKTNFMFQNMNSEEEDMVIIVAALNLIKRKRYKKYKKSWKKISIWTKPLLLRRPSLGIYNTLIEELV